MLFNRATDQHIEREIADGLEGEDSVHAVSDADVPNDALFFARVDAQIGRRLRGLVVEFFRDDRPAHDEATVVAAADAHHALLADLQL